VAWSTVFIGVPVILAGMLAGPTRTATWLRRLMAPYLRDRPDVSFGVVGLLLLLLLAWGPIGATRTWTGILLIIVLVFFGTEMLRRQTAREFPDAHLASTTAVSEAPTSPLSTSAESPPFTPTIPPKPSEPKPPADPDESHN
jgi:hypothetical protein